MCMTMLGFWLEHTLSELHALRGTQTSQKAVLLSASHEDMVLVHWCGPVALGQMKILDRLHVAVAGRVGSFNASIL